MTKEEEELLQTHRYWLQVINDEALDACSQWEQEFLESIEQRLNKWNKPLTDRQAEILERIYAEKTK